MGRVIRKWREMQNFEAPRTKDPLALTLVPATFNRALHYTVILIGAWTTGHDISASINMCLRFCRKKTMQVGANPFGNERIGT